MDDNEKLREDLAKKRTFLASERTRFSAERTISSWIRTGLASVGGGFTIVHLLAFQTVSHRIIASILGEILIIWGIVILIFSLSDYRKICKKIEEGFDKTNKLWITITVFVFVLVSMFLFFVTI